MKAAPSSFDVPYKNPVITNDGLVDRAWSLFFRGVQQALSPLGTEKAFSLVNNQSSAADIEGLVFDYTKVGQVSVDYLIQRVTTSTGATELIEAGTFYLAYKPTSNAWALSGGPSTAGITLSVTAAGQVRYTSSNITGTASISKITYRARTLSAKNAQYSVTGGV